MRPDRIVVGEVRSSEAIDLLQAMNTGHEGSMGTLHANSALDAFSRLETMVLSAGMDLPIRAIREQMASAINIIVHMGRDKEGVRRILLVSEVEGIEMDSIRVTDIFRFERLPGSSRGDLIPTGLIPRCMQRIEDAGIRMDYSIFQASNATTSGGVKTVVSSSGKGRSQQKDAGRPSEDWSWDQAVEAAPPQHPHREPTPPPAPEPVYESYEPEQPFDVEAHPALPDAQWSQLDASGEQEWSEDEASPSPSKGSKGLLRRLDSDQDQG
jgi:hypothetical protein